MDSQGRRGEQMVWSPQGARGRHMERVDGASGTHEGLQGTRSLECVVLRGLAGVQERGWAWGCRAGWLGSWECSLPRGGAREGP